jgi:hypothetical protein
MRKIHWTVWSLFAAIALFAGGFVLVGDHTRTSDPRGISAVANVQPVNLVGTWNQKSGDGGVTMTATITSDGKISIGMSSDVISGAYWAGTFKTSSTDGQIVSKADGDPQLSQDTTKTFTYKDGDLSFEFSMLGNSATVHLQRSAE